jgi:hypothetical protein
VSVPEQTVEAVINFFYSNALEEIRQMAEAARVEIDKKLGYPPAFIARASAQRRRFARQRQPKEQA